MADSETTLNQGQDGDEGTTIAQESETVDIKVMSKDQLLEYAGKIGVKAKPAMNKDEIIQVIEDFQAGGHPTFESQGQAKDIPIGTIRIIEDVEMVNVGGGGWVPTIRENIVSDKPVVIVSKKRAGKTIFAKTGKPITFDANGKATASAIDGLYLKSIVIEGTPEYTIEGNEQ